MTPEAWLAKVALHKDVLLSFIRSYHPFNLQAHRPKQRMSSEITAPQAERACEIIRQKIQEESLDFPDIQFTIALDKGDHSTIANLLSSAWIGVPESTSCWGIEGFGQAVDLLDDPVEIDYSPEETQNYAS